MLRKSFLSLPILFLFPLSVVVAEENITCYADHDIDFQTTIEKSRKLVEEFVAKRGIVGLSIAVSYCDKLVWSQGFGFADLENSVLVTPKTKFRIGSVSKALTTAAMGKLYEQEALDFDKEIQVYVPSFPKKKYPITVRQIAGHLAGIRAYAGDEFLISKRYPSLVSGLEIFQDDPLLHEPGSQFYYTSHGWNLLSAAVENAAGQDFLPYMQKTVFDPLGMKNTVADYTNEVIPFRTRFYEVAENGTVENAAYVDNSYKWSSGGYLSNAEDLNLFGNAILFHKIWQKTTYDLFTAPMKTNDGNYTSYGYGWETDMFSRYLERVKLGYGSDVADEIFVTLKDQGIIGHGGSSMGGSTAFWILPKTGFSVAAISNSNLSPFVMVNVTAEFVRATSVAD